jgi:hypothetical protein
MRYFLVTALCILTLFQPMYAQNQIEKIVDKQLAAYNAHDIETFLSCYSKDATTYIFPNKKMDEGHEALRKEYSEMFEAIPGLKAEVISRIVEGNFVIDKEKLTGYPAPHKDLVVYATAIYEIKDGLIKQVWFINSK